MASPHHRNQSSLEGVIDFSSNQSFQANERNRATSIFNQLISYYEPIQGKQGPYNQITLIRVTHEYALSQDNFLGHFFLYIERGLALQEDLSEPLVSRAISRFDDFHSRTTEQKNELGNHLAAFANYLVENFFLPLKASARKTPQPTPALLSGIQTAQQITGTTQRLSALRRDCLIRDHHRCVISRKFDLREAQERVKRDGDSAADNDGQLLKDETERPEHLEVAHILPHSLTSLTAGAGQTQLNDSKKTALAILDMFAPGAVHLIDGPNIDRSINALTLTLNFHQLFGDFEISFEPTQTQHTYKIDSTQSLDILRDPIFPVTRTLYLTSDRTIDPPSPQLLAIHRAIASILRLSGAGDYINRILRDMEEVDIKADGSTNLGWLVGLRVGDWMNEIRVR